MLFSFEQTRILFRIIIRIEIIAGLTPGSRPYFTSECADTH